MNALAERLEFEPGSPGVLLNAPPDIADRLLSGPSAPTVWRDPGEDLAWGLAFCRSTDEAERFGAILDESLREDAPFWMAFPAPADDGAALSRDRGWGGVLARGYLPVHEVGLDRRWSALRFRRWRALGLTPASTGEPPIV